jgi:phosphate transport system substrate-binding protein
MSFCTRAAARSPLKIISFLLILSTVWTSLSSAAEQVRIGGTGGALAAMRKLASEFQRSHPGVAITVLPSLGSTGGIRAVLSGALDLGISSRRLSDAEQGVVAHELGRTPFVFAVRKDNPATGTTIGDIEAIYTGATRTWPNGQRLRVVLRPEAEYDTALLKSMSPGMERAVNEALSREGMIVAVTDQDNAQTIEKVPGALGTTTMAQIITEELPFKMLSLNGVRPGLDTLGNGSYPYFKTYYLVEKPGSRPVVRDLVRFILSSRGREILSRCGYRTLR